MLKTSTHNARFGRARSQHHSILYDDGEGPGPGTFVATQSNHSLNAPNILARPGSQRERIRHASAIRHRILIDNMNEIFRSVSEEMEVAAVAVAAVPDVTISQIPTQTNTAAAECCPDLTADACDFSYVTTSSDDLCTPPYTPTRRTRIVRSDSYGGSINYSLRLSRDTDEFNVIMDRINKLRRETSDWVDAHATEELSLGF
ncbi:hypothetical protein P691DRAFT_761261 [Macrolepiota fuliginosa MF-IS2]|uniref:Uncharacterized protein n=1 Tax=Macrolepiota fuliginosa MF-IS2 TaxID=1400762 RepID=A0A9P6C2W3_9AGAR|nr:hypothetical protein P691DRAFT_761261 [Macrolepiota fuliginosa MF-IS2]